MAENKPHLASMQKRSSKQESDPNLIAESIVDQATGQAIPDDTVRQVMREMGRRGGLKGGKARAAKLTDAERLAIAKTAAAARWSVHQK